MTLLSEDVSHHRAGGDGSPLECGPAGSAACDGLASRYDEPEAMAQISDTAAPTTMLPGASATLRLVCIRWFRLGLYLMLVQQARGRIDEPGRPESAQEVRRALSRVRAPNRNGSRFVVTVHGRAAVLL